MDGIYEKKVLKGVIEYDGGPVILVHRIIIFNDFNKGYHLVTMDKYYQNDNESEHNEIDNKLFEIFDNDGVFTLNCYGEGTYLCKFCSKPEKGLFKKMEAKILSTL